MQASNAVSVSETPPSGEEQGTRSFKYHAGGVIHVNYKSHFGVVPETLLEDKRLTLEARLVAAWLATRPNGWQIVNSVLQRRLGIGEDQWESVSTQLRETGYLVQSKTKAPNGRWVWNRWFCADPAAIPGHAGHGAAKGGVPVPGGTATGRSADKEVPSKAVPRKQDQRNTTITPRPVVVEVEGSPDSGENKNPIHPNHQELCIWIIQQYHSTCTDLAPIIGGYSSLTKSTAENLMARAQEHPEHAFWEAYFQRVHKADILCGRVANMTGWVADFSWLMTKENLHKVLERGYSSGTRSHTHTLFGRGNEVRDYSVPPEQAPRLSSK